MSNEEKQLKEIIDHFEKACYRIVDRERMMTKRGILSYLNTKLNNLKAKPSISEKSTAN